jgi:hypothetical protein
MTANGKPSSGEAHNLNASADEIKRAAEAEVIKAIVFQVVSQIGKQLSEAGHPPPVLWWVLHCSARAVEHGLMTVAEQQTDPAERDKYLSMLGTARMRLPEFIEAVDCDVTTTIPLSDDAQECAEWKLWALSELGRPEYSGDDWHAVSVGELRRELAARLALPRVHEAKDPPVSGG